MYKWVFSERLKLSGDEHRRIASGRVFQARGPATAKARSPSVERRVAGTVKSAEEAERRRRRGSMFSTGRNITLQELKRLYPACENAQKHSGVTPKITRSLFPDFHQLRHSNLWFRLYLVTAQPGRATWRRVGLLPGWIEARC